MTREEKIASLVASINASQDNLNLFMRSIITAAINTADDASIDTWLALFQ